MNAPPHSGWRTHGLAMPLAVVLAVLFAWWLNGRWTIDRALPPDPRLHHPLHGYLDNYSSTPRLSAILARTLADGSSIVLMGSSELTTTDHPAKPVNFFNRELGRPLFALGHAGNQSFSMHAQLIAADVDLANARLAILISPSWFIDRSATTGTELAAFLEYQPSPSLYRVQRRVKAGDTLAAPVSAYLAEHERELGAAQPITLWLIRNASRTARWRYFFSQPLNAAIINATRDDMLFEPRLADEALPDPEDTAAIDWSARFDQAKAEHLARCTNNNVHVNDAYYAEHVQRRTRQVYVHPLEANRELRDFHGLLAFLKASHAEPYFILQPLNPFVYTNLKEVDPTINAVRDALDRRGFKYLDLWVSDTAAFVPGTLTDVMHLGPLGWYRVDSALATFFP